MLCEAEGTKVGAVCGGVPTLDGTSLPHLHSAGKPAATPLPATGCTQYPSRAGGSVVRLGPGLWAGAGTKASAEPGWGSKSHGGVPTLGKAERRGTKTILRAVLKKTFVKLGIEFQTVGHLVP